MLNKILSIVYVNEGLKDEIYTEDGFKTKYGIRYELNKAWLNKHGVFSAEAITEYIRDLFYKMKLESMNIDLINSLSLAYNVFDMGINSGTSNAIEILQECINLFRGKALISVDGKIGKQTIGAINNIFSIYGESALIQSYIQARKTYYMDVLNSMRRKKQFTDKKLMDFLQSWNNRTRSVS